MEIGNIIPHIEALIFASEKPLTAIELTELANNAFGFMDEKLTLEQIQTAIDGIVEKYRSEFYPFEVRESGGGLQFLTKKEYHKTVAQLNGEKFLKKLSTAALETLSIIAYKQPVTKGEIEAIRGVSSDYAIQRLLEKELVVITGRNEKLPGHPLVYATSRTFMDYFGINSPDDLPKLKEVFDEAAVNPTIMDGINTSAEPDENDLPSGESELLAVTQNGELTTAKLNPDAKDFPRKPKEAATQPDGNEEPVAGSDDAGVQSFTEGETGNETPQLDEAEIVGEENSAAVGVNTDELSSAVVEDNDQEDDDNTAEVVAGNDDFNSEGETAEHNEDYQGNADDQLNKDGVSDDTDDSATADEEESDKDAQDDEVAEDDDVDEKDAAEDADEDADVDEEDAVEDANEDADVDEEVADMEDDVEEEDAVEDTDEADDVEEDEADEDDDDDDDDDDVNPDDPGRENTDTSAEGDEDSDSDDSNDEDEDDDDDNASDLSEDDPDRTNDEKNSGSSEDDPEKHR